ncbi:acyl-CoA dehydrogenase family protein [soil metagenome]
MTSLSSLQSQLRSACDRLGREAEKFDVEGADPAALCEPLKSAGLFRDPPRDTQGGVGLAEDAEGLCEVLIAIGAANLSAARIYEGHVNALQLVARLGDARQVRDMEQAVAAGAVYGVWNAEAPPGLTLQQSPQGLRLVGGKIYASGIGVVTHPLVTAKTSEGEVRLVSPGPPGASDLSGWRARGMRATATGTVDYSGHAVTESMLIGVPGAYYEAPHFKGGAWRFAAAQAGAILRIQTLVSEGLAARGRRDEPAQRARQADLAIAAHGAQTWCRQAARMEAGAGADPAAFESFVGLTRLAVESAAMQAIALAERSVGLSAFLRPDALDRVVRDLSVYLRQPFPDAVRDEVGAYVGRKDGCPPWSALREPPP